MKYGKSTKYAYLCYSDVPVSLRWMLPLFSENRVSPLGELVAAAWRGSLMGNRGRIAHGQPPAMAWITCTLSPREGRQTEPLYTKLFFSDEAASLAAGHRPCAQCRPAEYKRFKAAWCQALGTTSIRAHEIDRRLARDRSKPRSLLSATDIAGLPDGAFVLADRYGPCAAMGGLLLPWRDGRCADAIEPRSVSGCRLVTPATTLEAMRAGYQADISKEGEET